MPAVLHRRSVSHRTLCFVLAVLTLASPAPLLAQETATAAAAPAGGAPLDGSYALPDACFAMVLRPAQVFRAPAAAMVPYEVIQAAVMQETGLDALAAEQLVLTITPPVVGPPAFSLHSKFSAPFTLNTDNLPLPVNEEELNGKRYLHAQGDPSGPSFYFPDDASFVTANELAISALTGAERANPGPLLTKFLAADRGDDLLAMVDLEPLRPLIGMAMGQAGLPPEMAEFGTLPNLIKTVELHVNLSHEAPSELIVSANNEADALALVAAFDKVKGMMTAQMSAQARELLASEDPVEQASGRYAQRMMVRMDQQMQLAREGDRLIIFRTDPSQPGANNQMVQVAVIGVLVALLLPAVQAAREAARRNTSLNYMKMMMLALHNFASAQGTFPAHAKYSADGKPLLSWRVMILPYMEQQALYEQFHLDEPWDSEHNKTLIPLMPDMYRDSSSSHATADGLTNFLGVAGEGRLFDGTEKGRRMAAITDGMSNTLAIVQVSDDSAVEWTRPDDWEMDEAAPVAGLGGLNAGGVFLAAFCDGHVEAISTAVDPTVLKAISTVEGGEVVDGGY